MKIKRFCSIVKRQVSSYGAVCYYRMQKNKEGLNHKKRETSIVVTMTSFPARFKTIHLAIKSLMSQTFKPDKIVLYLDDTVKDEQITPKMNELVKCGLEIRKRPIDMKVHKKYYYAMKEFPDAIIITADDDCMYRKDLIERLMRSHIKFPNAICSKRVHRMLLDSENNLKPYNDWEMECHKIEVPSMELCATGVGGVLYPPHLLDQTLFDIELLMKLSPKADDLWLKYIEVISNVPVVRAEGNYDLSYMIQSVQDLGLRNKNVGECENDVFLKRLQEHFKVDWKKTIAENKYCRQS